MTVTLITTSGLVNATAHLFAAPADGLFVAQGVTWGATNGSIINTSLNNVSATFAGDVIATYYGVRFNGDNSMLRILSTGSITSFDPSGPHQYQAIFLNGSDNNLINDGHVSGTYTTGVVSAGGNHIDNRGSIDAASRVFLGLSGGTGDTLVNFGIITVNTIHDDTSNTRYNNGVMSEGYDTVILNLASGVISATCSEGAGVRLHAFAGGSTVENHGTIVSLNHYGVSFDDMSAGQTATLLNTGVITGATGAFVGSDQADVVTNQGQMNGDVVLGDDADVFDRRGGSVIGTVRGGGGNDTFIIDDVSIRLSENNADGTDLVQSLVGWKLGGHFENLNLLGDADIRGVGNDGNNLINGNIGDNRIYGRAGSDTIAGDVFVFRKALHSTNVPNADHITHFKIGEDLIDLSAFAGEFDFVTGAFTGTAAEVRITTGSGNSRVRIDPDGDGVTDMNIIVDGVMGLTAADFLL